MMNFTMKKTTFSIIIPESFNFRTLLYSHGWRDLAPFSVSADDRELQTVISLPKNIVVNITSNNKALKVIAASKHILTSFDKKAIKDSVRSMFRMNESLDEFYSLCNSEKHLRWIPSIGGGRMLRSATVFEDIVKMICTTNCSWSLTKILVTNLTTKLGEKAADGVFTFPTPEAIASKSDKWIRKNISAGYRSPFLLELSERVSSGTLSVESLRTDSLKTEELYTFLRSIKGVGHYAAGNLLKLLGHYDYLGIDSWIRSRFSEIHKNGRSVSDSVIEKHYAKYGKWKGLVCWMEMTKDWHIE